MFKSKEEFVASAEERSAELVKKKERSMIRIYDEPVLPSLCRMIFRGMLILLAAMLLVDINAFFRYGSYLGFLHLFSNIAMTGFFCWLFCSVFLIPLCLLAIRQSARRFWKQKEDSGIIEETEADRERNQRALKKMNRYFVKYLKIDLIGLAAWGIAYLISMWL